MTSENNTNYMIMLIFSGIAALLMLFTDYGGLYYWGYYVESWVYIHPFNGFLPAILIIPPLGGFVFIGIMAQRVSSEKRDFTDDELNRVKMVNRGIIGFLLVGFIAFMINVFEADSWWFDAGFYSSTIGAAVNTYVLSNLTISPNQELKGASFCKQCGANVQGLNFCKECGSKV